MRSAHAMFAGLRTRARIGIFIEALAVVLIATVSFVAVSYAADRTLELEREVRMVVAGVFAVFVAWLVQRRLLRPLRLELDDDEMALAVERVDPQLRQALISAVQFERGLQSSSGAVAMHGESAPLMRQVIETTEQRLREVRAVRALDAKRVLRSVGLAVLALGALGGWSYGDADEAGLWWRRNVLFASELWPRETALEFVGVPVGEPLRLAERENLTLRVAARGVVPDRVVLHAKFADGTVSERPFDQVADREQGDREFQVQLESVMSDVVVYAVGNDGRTADLQVQLVPRPRIDDLRVVVTPPDYLQLEPYEADILAGSLPVVVGTQLAISARSTKPLRTATLRVDQDSRLPCEVFGADRDQLRVKLTPTDSGVLGLDVTDEDDLGPDDPPRLSVQVVADELPVLDFRSRGIGSMVTAVARIPGLLEVRDDHGVHAVRAEWRTVTPELEPSPDGAPPPEAPFEPAPISWEDALKVGTVEQQLGLSLDLLPFAPDAEPNSPNNKIRPGMVLTLAFTGHDARGEETGSGPRSQLTLRVVTREVLLEDLQRRRDEQRRALESVRDQVLTARGVLADVLAPTEDDELHRQARTDIENLSRRQIALGKKAADIAQRYGRILDELTNNRLFEPGVTRSLAERIVDPLEQLSSVGFPESADLGEAFARTGSEDARSEVVAACDAILTSIQGILAAMGRTEDIAALVESLRIVIRSETEAARLVEALRDAEGAGVFDDPGTEPGGGGDEGGGKNGKDGNLDAPTESTDRERR